MTSTYSTFQLIRDIRTFLLPYRKRFLIGSFLRVTSDIVWLFPIWAISQIINFATTYQAGQSLHTFWWLTLGVWLVAVYHSINQDLAKYFIYPIAEQINIDVQLKTLKHMFKLDSQWHERENSGNKIQRLTRGGDSFNELIRLYADVLLESTVSIVGITFILFDLGWVFILILIFFFVSYFFLSFYLTKKASAQSNLANIEWEKFDGVIFESVNNIATIRSLGIADSIHRILSHCAQRLMKEIRLRVIRFRTRESVLNLYKELFRQMLLFYTVWNVFQGQYEVGVIALVLLYFYKIESSAYEFAEISNRLILAKIAIVRMMDILHEAPTVEVSGTRAFPRNWNILELKNISFSYHGRKILNGFDLQIKRGEKVGLVGLSGAGKSTLFKLLLKLYENYEGDICFDSTSLRDIRRASYIERVAHVPQETELFNLSLKDNVLLAGGARKGLSDRLKRALHIAHVDDFLNKLPVGMDSLIGEKGIKLSGGERQRVGIARAVYKHPEILFLDEATSHLDGDSEKKIQAALHSFFKGVTAVVIAHRLSTLKEMDRIVVLNKGRVVEQGSFEQLLKQKGEFWKLWQKQS